MENNITIIEDFSYAFSILNYSLVGASIGIMCICLFWLWYYITSVYGTKRELENTNKYDTVNNECRKSVLWAQQLKYKLFIGILACEFLKKFISLSEYFYIVNVFMKSSLVELHSQHQPHCSIEPHFDDSHLKGPILIFIQALNITTTLCLVSLIAMALLHISNMFKMQYRTTSIKGLMLFLATKAVFVLILSSTIWLYLVGYLAWLMFLIVEWILVVAFSAKLNRAVMNRKCNKDVPAELNAPSNRSTTKECRVIKLVTCIVTLLLGLYVVAQILSISIEIGDIVYFRPCLLTYIHIYIKRSTRDEIIAYITTRDALISVVYAVVFLFDFTIFIMHIFFFASNWKKIAERLSCRVKKVVRYEVESEDLKRPLMGYEQMITNESATYVNGVEGCSDKY